MFSRNALIHSTWMMWWLLFTLPTSFAQSFNAPSVTRVPGGGINGPTDGAGSAALERRTALVIGNANYAHIPALDNPVNDARDMCKALRSLNFNVLCHEDVRTKRDMKFAISEYVAKLQAGSVGLFYYAGHGLQVDGENYMVPAHAQLQVQADVEDEAISLHYLMSQLDKAKNAFNVVILDACRDNPLSTWRGARVGGLAPVDAPAGTMVIFATAPGKAALDGGRSGNGMFTSHLLMAIAQPGVTVEEMAKTVIRGVQLESKQDFGLEQVPWVNSSFTGRFCFAGCEDPQHVKELVKIKEEREALLHKTQQLESENLEREKRIAALEGEAQKARAVLEERSKQVQQAGAGRKPTQESSVELAKLQQQLGQLRVNNKELSEQTAKFQQEKQELQVLKARLAQMETRSAEVEALNKKIVQLEKERAESADQVVKLRSESRSLDEKSRSGGRQIRHLPPTF